MTRYEFFLMKRNLLYDNFDASDLNPLFIPYFNNQKRIEVKFSWGEIKRGRVAVTSGWKPGFLLMLTSRSIGSSYILDKDVEFIKVIG